MYKPVVLIVDDSLTARTIIARTLYCDAFTLAFAGDGLSAFAAVVDLLPAVILLDVQLPHMDGYTICHLLRKNVLYKDIPIVMVTSKDRVADRMHGRLVGTTEYLTKPFDPEELACIVQKHVAYQHKFPLYHKDILSLAGRFCVTVGIL